MEQYLRKIHARKKDMREKYKSLMGTQIVRDNATWKLIDVNDLGVPYFVKVVKNISRKTKYTLTDMDKNWLDNLLELTKK